MESKAVTVKISLMNILKLIAFFTALALPVIIALIYGR